MEQGRQVDDGRNPGGIVPRAPLASASTDFFSLLYKPTRVRCANKGTKVATDLRLE